MSELTGIYEIKNLSNGKRYIGSAVDFGNRWRVHAQSLKRGDHHSRALQRAWNKYSPAAFQFNRLIVCSKENLIMYEQAAIDAFNPEYNCAPKAGSQLGYKHSEESRKRMSESRPKDFSPMTGKSHTEEARAKISANRKGKCIGIVFSDERKRKISDAHKGRSVSQETRDKIAETLRGHKQSQEQIEKRVQKLRGRKMPPGFAEATAARMRGKKLPPAHVLNMRKAKSSLSDECVRQVRSFLASGLTQRAVSALTGASVYLVCLINSRKAYEWVE